MRFFKLNLSEDPQLRVQSMVSVVYSLNSGMVLVTEPHLESVFLAILATSGSVDMVKFEVVCRVTAPAFFLFLNDAFHRYLSSSTGMSSSLAICSTVSSSFAISLVFIVLEP